MPENKFPRFPSPFVEEDLERMEELERLSVEQRSAYKGLVPWKKKPIVERTARRVAEKVYAPPKGFRAVTPWEERGFTPEQADIYIRETEEELTELKRRQTVTKRLPPITDYITALAMGGFLTGEEAQLYELIPELNPSSPGRLNISEEERDWFLEYSKSLSGKSEEDILNVYAEGGFPAPKTVSELMNLVQTTFPHDPRQVFATVEFLKDSEEVEKAIRDMYPSQVEGEVSPADNINTELENLGLIPTGDIKKDIEALEKARTEQVLTEGVPTQVRTESGEIINVNVKGEDVLFEGKLVSHYNPETKKYLPLSPAEEYELDNTPPPLDQINLNEALRRLTSHWLTDAQVERFWDTDGSPEQIKLWLSRNVTLTSPEKIDDKWLEPFQKLWSGASPKFDLITEADMAYQAGWGDVLSIAGGASRWLGAEGIANSFYTKGDKLQRTMPIVADLSAYNYMNLLNPRYYSTPEFKSVFLHGVRTVPFCMSLLPAALLGWYGGIAVSGTVATKFALGAFATRILAAVFGGVGGAALSRPMESAAEAISAFDRILSQEGSMTEAHNTATRVFWDNMKLAGLDAAQITVALAPLPSTVKVFGRAIGKNLFRVARMGGRAGIECMLQGGEEYYQTSVTRRAEGQEDPWKFDSEAQLATTLGGMMGLGWGVGGDVLSDIINKTEDGMTPSQKKDYDADVKEVGEIGALDNLAKTPEGAKLVEEVVKVVEEQQLNRELIETEEIKDVAIVPEIHVETGEKYTAVVYRGIREKGVPPLDEGLYGKGTYYTSNYNWAETYGKVSTQKVTLENPYVVRSESELAELRDIARNLRQEGLVREMVPKDIETFVAEGIREEIEGRGHDGIIAQNLVTKGEEIVVFHPKKSISKAEVEAVKTETIKPRRKVHIKEKKFLEEQLASIEKELVIIKASLRSQRERLEVQEEDRLLVLDGTVDETKASIKNLEGILSELNTKKASIESKLGVLERIETIPEKVIPEELVEAPQAKWDALSLPSRVAWADKAGIARTAAKLPWSELTDVQQENLSKSPMTELPPVAPEVLTLEQELMGKGFNVKAAEEQAKNLGGYQEAVISIGDISKAVSEALKHIDEHFFNADGSNPLDIAATAAWKLGSVEEYVKFLPPDINKNVSQEFRDADFADVSEHNLNSMDTIRGFAAIDKGHFGGVARRKVLSVTERLHMAYFNIYGAIELKYLKLEQEAGLDRPSWWKLRAKKEFNEATFNLMSNISQKDPGVATTELLQRDNIKDILKDYTQEQQTSMVNWAKGLRSLWDELITNQNAVRVKLGLEAIPYRNNYVSWVYEPNLWSRLLGLKINPDFIKETAVAPDFIKPSEPFVAHALAREGGLEGYTKIKDVRRLFLDYADTAAKDMFFTPIVMNARAHAFVLREKGFAAPAQWMLDWCTESYAGLPSFISRAFRKSMFAPIRRPLIALRRNLTRAVFPLNWTWNLFVQTTSIALTAGQYGTGNTLMGSQYLWNPKIRKLINEECFSYIIKKRAEGSIVYQDLGATISRFQYVGRSPIQTVETAMNFLTRAIETNVTGVSCYAAYLKGQKMGLTGRALIDYASEGGAKTQSMYNMQNVPGTIRSPEVGAVFPFQTFCFEAMNFVRELSGVKVLRAGAYETIAADTPEGQATIQNRLGHMFEFLAAVFVLNILGDFAINRRPWQPTSFIPFVGIMMSGLDPYNTWYYPMPVRYTAECTTGIKNVIEYGDWSRLRSWFLSYHCPAGVQASRTIDGIIASIEGREVKDVRGEVMFEFEDKPIEFMKAITMGVYQTESGREYRDRVFEGAEPTTISLLKDLDKLEEQLGEEHYTLSNYGSDSLALLRERDIPQWQIFGEETGYPSLFQFKLYCDIMWEEYDKLPANERLKYRKDNPYVDASLYFWERTKTLRSHEAEDYLEGLFNQFIPGNTRAHWRGLPIIPEEMKLLPE